MTATERTYPILSRVCIGVGVAFLAFSAFGNFRFGWSLGTNLIDSLWLSAIYGGSDIAAGVLVATGATMLNHAGWRWKIGGIVALVPALILISLSVLSTFGMMSGRIAVLEGQKAAVTSDLGRLAWLRRQTVNYDLPKSERRAFIAEERAAAKEARKAASVVTDNQAVALSNAAALIGVKLTTEQTQVGLTFVSSTMPMMIKFVCIGLGFFLFGARADVNHGANQKNSDGSGGSGGSGKGEPGKLKVVQGGEPSSNPKPLRAGSPRTMHVQFEPASSVRFGVSTDAPTGKLTYEQFLHDLREDMAHGDLASSTRAIAARTGWSQSSVVRQAQRLRGKAAKHTRRFAGNGGGFHVSAMG